MDKICQILGPVSCLHVSQDNKESVAIGKTAAKVQVPLLMSMRYRVRMPDHDFAVGTRHLLVPSVMAICIIDPLSGLVTYSGPTLIRIRSSKHNNSSAFSHQEDMLRFGFVSSYYLLNYSLFYRLKEASSGFFDGKSVLMKGVDGGPDENPRFSNNIIMAIKTFKVST